MPAIIFGLEELIYQYCDYLKNRNILMKNEWKFDISNHVTIMINLFFFFDILTKSIFYYSIKMFIFIVIVYI